MSRKQIIFNKEELKLNYLELKEISITAKFYNVSESVIRKNLKKFNISLNKIARNRNKKSKYKVNDNFFAKDTEESFYIAGFIAADGCVMNNTLSINLSLKDKDHLIKINNIINSNRVIKDYHNKYSGASRLLITSKQIINDLKRFNIVPRKSLIYTFPEWMKTHPLKHHFMRGYFDGDGSVYLNNQYNEKVCFGLRGTIKFLIDYRAILEKECGFCERTNPIPISSGCGLLGYGGNKNISKIADFIYKDATIFLNRKKDVALKANQLLENFYA